MRILMPKSHLCIPCLLFHIMIKKIIIKTLKMPSHTGFKHFNNYINTIFSIYFSYHSRIVFFSGHNYNHLFTKEQFRQFLSCIIPIRLSFFGSIKGR